MQNWYSCYVCCRLAGHLLSKVGGVAATATGGGALLVLVSLLTKKWIVELSSL